MRGINKVIIILLLILCLFGCKSTKKEADESGKTGKVNYTNQSLEFTESEDEIDVGAVNLAVEQEEATLIESPFIILGADDDVTKNWMQPGATKSNVENQIGGIKIKAKGRIGAFNLYAIDRQGKGTPVFSIAEEFTATSFYLLAGKKVYKLSGGTEGISMAAKTPNGMQVYYSIPKVADVRIDFTIFKSNPVCDDDMVKVTATVKSTSTRSTVYGLKLVMDTILGEKSKAHFYNSDNLPVRAEVMYRTLQKTNWLISKNEYTSLQVLLSGADISPVDFVAVANFETLNTLAWEPNMLSERTFNTVRSYNNSAIGINWIAQELLPEQEASYVFYMAFASDSEVPNGEKFIKDNTEALDETNQNDMDETVPSYDNLEDELDGYIIPDYIQKILDRIAELQEDDPDLNKEELLLLSTELDYYLEELRK